MTETFEKVLARLTFAVMHRSMMIYESFNIPVISTTRPFRFYRKALFDNHSKQQIKKELNDKTLIDVGCGLTPFIEDSMFQWCRRNAIDFYGIDPKVKNGFRFGTFDRLKSLATGARTKPNPNIEGLDKTVATYANDLPFENDSVDIILSCWLIFSWLRNESLLTDSFSEFDRILKVNGSIRIFPTHSWDSIIRKYPSLQDILKNYQVEQRFMVGPDLGNVPPAYTTRLTKLS